MCQKVFGLLSDGEEDICCALDVCCCWRMMQEKVYFRGTIVIEVK